MSGRSGRFIVVEGPDGAGKTSLVGALSERMKAGGHEPVVVREPGGTPAAEALRQELLNRSRVFDPLTELLYLTAARADLIHHLIGPALAQGRTVLSDRFDLSTHAYQVAGRGLDPTTVGLFNVAATGGLRADLVLILDIPPDLGMDRQKAAGKRQDRLDLEDSAFQGRVAAAYLAATGPGMRHLNGAQARQKVVDDAWQEIQNRWPDIFRSDRVG